MSMRWFVLVFLAGLPVSQTVAQITDFSWIPAEPVIGEAVDYFPVGEAPMGYMAAHRWEYRYAPTQPTIGGGCEMPWVATNWGVMSLHAEQNVPGDFQIRLTVSYTSYMLPPGPPIPNTVKTKTVSIAPPNRVEIIDGMDEPALFADPVIVEFQIYSGSQPIGPYAYGFVQTYHQSMVSCPSTSSPGIPS